MAIPKPNTGNQQGDNVIPQTPASQMIAPPRADFDKNRFDVLVAQKGVDVAVEKALQCPCETQKVNSLSTCKNCGGTGWVFVNKRRSRLVLQSMDFKNTEEVWSRLVHGVIRVTGLAEEELSFMDRITRLNANSIFSEIIQFEEGVDGTFFGFTTYEPKDVEYIGIFTTVDDKFQQLSNKDFSIHNTRIEINEGVELPYVDENNPLTATIRYVHAPVFYIFEHQREVIDNYRWTGKGEKLQYLPTLALARRAHDVEDMANLRQGRLNDNSYNDSSCLDQNIYKPKC